MLWLSSLGLTISYLLYQRCFTALSKVPGPFTASCGNFWKLRAAYKADMPRQNLDLHRQYGPVVRTGSSTVSVDDPAALSIIYGFKTVYNKSAFYELAEGWYHGRPLSNMITTRSKTHHTHLRRNAMHAYTPATALSLEATLEPSVAQLLHSLTEQCRNGKGPIDVASWLMYFAFDAIGRLNFSEDLGYLATGSDVEGRISGTALVLTYLSVIGQAPWLHKLMFGNATLQKLLDIEKTNPIQNLAIDMVKKRIAKGEPNAPKDILDLMLINEGPEPSKLAIHEIIGLTTTNLIAAPGTVAITLRALLYYLCRNPTAYKLLEQEIDMAFESGALSLPVKYEPASKLRYLEASITEALRMHPTTGLLLERDVPAGGVELAGHYLPEGTVVGINAWVMNRNKVVYGPDSDFFRPERWLEDPSRVVEMRKCLLSFGAGPRTCAGRNFAMMEMIKVVPSLIRKFDFRLADPVREWKVQGHWFAHQSEMDMFVTERRGI
ncbi:hypothetical protein CERZMDRAFT_31895 [Cercospora zeae-maydis SCOH1-5]|uniref:Ig-like domain-containing protein n=1 Tax=Cercospora zeae-maydis SCOH1-5 TaxID=717836 RepID=A0A6A6FTT5_9PEZI|nr:hypothetical protein CERZMDRAFT_31895 [Cercospora zeae-maydis SCOH1-5]